jgi:hypothetical protein
MITVETPLTLVSDDDLLEIGRLIESKFPRGRYHHSLYHQLVFYKKAIRLYNEGLTWYEVSKELGIRESATYHWLVLGRKPWSTYKIPPATFDFGYLLGSGIGDGTMSANGKKLLYKWIKDEDFADKIVESARNLNVYAYKWYRERGWFVIISNVVISELVWIGKTNPYLLLPIISNMKVGRGVLSGWFDAEGSPAISGLSEYKYCVPCAASTNKELIEVMGKLLDMLNIHYTINKQETKEIRDPRTRKVYKPKSEKLYRLRIRRCCVIKFNEVISFRISRKKAVLEKIIQQSGFKNVCQ